MAGQGDSPTSPIDVLVAVTASRRLSMGGRPSGTLSATRLGSVSEEYPVHGGKEPSCGSGSLERPNTADASSKSGSLLGSPPAKGIGGERLLSGVPRACAHRRCLALQHLRFPALAVLPGNASCSHLHANRQQQRRMRQEAAA